MPWLPKKLQNVIAVTDCVALFWQPNPISVGRANPECRETAMKKNLFLAALILLATVWLALDAGVEALILFA
jgi:hypothetical protein